MIRFTLSQKTLTANDWDGPQQHDPRRAAADNEYRAAIHNATYRRVGRGCQAVIECPRHVAEYILRLLRASSCMDDCGGVDPETVREYRPAVKRDIERLANILETSE